MDSITLEGYPDTNEYQIELIAVDKSGNVSEPVLATIKPLTPPVDIVRETVSTIPTFGGVYVKWQNEFRKDVVVTLYLLSPTGEPILYDAHYSSAEDGYTTFRGLDTIKQAFRIEMHDRWNHYTAPYDFELTPLFEEEIPGRNRTTDVYIWSQYGFADGTCKYRGDVYKTRTYGNTVFARIHNNNLMESTDNWDTEANSLSYFIDGGSSGLLFPFHFTIDMGERRASYSRIKYWIRDRDPLYSATTFIEFEIWATNNPKDITTIGNGSIEDNLKYWTPWEVIGGTDAWKNDWEQIAVCNLNFPSGTPNTSVRVTRDDDIAFIRNGVDFDIKPEYADKPFRYVRFVIKKTNTGSPQCMISELKFFGAYEK